VPKILPRGAQTIGALVAYAVFTVLLTWPLLPHLGSSAYLVQTSSHGGDMAGSIAQLRELVDGYHNPFLPGHIQDFNAPDGLQIRWALNLATLPSTALLYALAIAFGATAAYGLFVMLGYTASGLAMFLLTRWLTGRAWIGLVTGWAFAFYPYAVVKGEHPPFVHGWVFVVMLWRFLVLIERPTALNGFWAGAASVLCFAWTQYFVLLGGVAFWTLTLAALAVGVVQRKFRRYLVALLPALGMAIGFVLVMRGLLLTTSEDKTLATNSLLDIVNTSAHLPMYLVPPAHHVLGGATVSYLNRHGWNAVEWTLYVGLSVLALALVGLIAAGLRRFRPPLSRSAAVAAALVVVAMVFSLPPEMDAWGRTVRMPSWLVYHTSSSWRIYARFVTVVMLGLCVLAALGLKALLQGRPARVQAAILALATVLIPLDLWNRPPDHIYRFETPSIYRALARQPAANAAEYPLRPVGFVGDYLDLYYQAAHRKPIVNGYFAGEDAQRASRLTFLNDPGTAGSLAGLNVRYVLLTPWRISPSIPDPGRPGRGFRLLARDDYGALYRVTAPPAGVVFYRDGFWGVEGQGSDAYQWAGHPPVRLGISAPCSICIGTLRFRAASFVHTRVVRLVDSDGRRLGGAIVGTRPSVVSLPIRFSRRAVVTLEITPGPQSISGATGTSDTREVSIYIQRPQLILAKASTR
jgi:hypothetical protein